MTFEGVAQNKKAFCKRLIITFLAAFVQKLLTENNQCFNKTAIGTTFSPATSIFSCPNLTHFFYCSA